MGQQTVKKQTLKPIGNRVLVKRLEQEEKIGGIILPETAKKKQETACVIAVGTAAVVNGKKIEIPVQVGDTILIDKYAGQEVTIDDEEFVILKADDIIAIVEA